MARTLNQCSLDGLVKPHMYNVWIKLFSLTVKTDFLKNGYIVLACCVPGQTAMLQNLVCFSGPSQGSPPNCGGVQVRVRDLKPRPQVDEHKLHGDHSSHAPCTVIRTARA